MVTNDGYFFPGPGSQTFTVNPAGSADDDTIQSISLAGTCSTSQWFLNTALDPQSIPGARVCGGGVITTPSGAPPTGDLVSCPRSYTFGVSFAGTQPGISTCNVYVSTIATTGSGSTFYIVDLSGSGSGSSGITVSPTTINFQDVPQMTTTSPVPVTVKNDGSASVTINGSFTGTAYTVTPVAPATLTNYTLGGGSAAMYNVTCRPPGLGAQPGTITFSSSDGDSGGVTLSCNGIDSSITLNPTQVTFDPTLVGAPPPPKTVAITGPMTDTLTTCDLDQTALDNGVTITSNPKGMQIGNGKSVTLAYSAGAVHENGPLGVLLVKSSSDMTIRNVAISGEALLGGIGTNPSTLEFGGVCAGAMGRKDLEVYANEAGNVQLSAVTPPQAPFAASVSGTLPKTLLGNHSGPSVQVTVTLQSSTATELTDQMMLVSNVPTKEMTPVTVHAVVLEAGIAATPNAVHFGSVMPGSTTGVHDVQLSNCGTTDLVFQNARIAGPDLGEFTLVGAYDEDRTLHPTESMIVSVIMQPHTNGTKSAQLVLEHSAGQTIVELDGDGLGENKDRETYYACSTGRPSAAWPLLLALLALRRRRR